MTEQIHPDRKKKIEKMRAEGRDPFPARGVVAEPIESVLASAGTADEPGPRVGEKVTIAGRALGLRDFGKLIFTPIKDRTGRMQVGLQKQRLAEWWPERKDLDGGDLVAVSGELGFTQKGEPTIWAEEVSFQAKALAPPPEKWHGLSDKELRYRRRYVDLWASDGVLDVSLEGSGPIEQCLGRILEAIGASGDPFLAPRLAARHQAYYQMRLRQDGHRVVDGARELLETWHGKGWMLAVLCAAPAAEVEAALEQLDVRAWIKTVKGGYPVTAEAYQDTWRQLNSLPPLPSRLLHPHDVWVLDSDPAALEAASSAGLVAVGLTSRHPAAALTVAGRTIDHPGQLIPAAQN